MKRKLKSIVIITILVFILSFIIIKPDIIINSVLGGINIWMYNIFPALFPFFVLSDLLVAYGFVELLSELLKNIMILFGVSKHGSFVFIGGLIGGSLSGVKIIEELNSEGLLTEEDCNHLIRFTHYPSPLFIIGTIGLLFLKNARIGYLIFVSQIIINILIGIIFRNRNELKFKRISIKEALKLMHKKRISNKDNFITILSNSINKTFNLLFSTLGIVIVFLIISNIIDCYVDNKYIIAIINGLLEVTQGAKLVSILNIPLIIKVVLCNIFLSFGGFSIHMQVSSLINNTKIKYKNFLLFRIIHSILSSILVFILFSLFY